MELSYQHLLPCFAENSRSWIFQSAQLLTLPQVLQIESELQKFIQSWTSHDNSVEGYSNIFFGYFLIFIAQEKEEKIGGCSTDTLFHFVREIEKSYQLSFLDRQLQAFVIKDKIQIIPFSQIQYAYKNKFINDNTLYFNNALHSLKELKDNWIQPINLSWLKTQHVL
ncbi:MAG: hypothetical protein ACRCR9_06970 [Chitinophagaceae bacterium]